MQAEQMVKQSMDQGKVQHSLDEETIASFQARLRGALIRSDSAEYDSARKVWSGLIDRRPVLIVRCSGVADVVEGVNFAREHQLLLSVRGGGHNVAGNAVNDGGIVLDLSSMKGIWVDRDARTVLAQGGVTWGELDRETQLFGLMTPGGNVSTTGIAGLTLHGGMGNLRRKYGLSIDNYTNCYTKHHECCIVLCPVGNNSWPLVRQLVLLSVDIVTADGQLRHASATENSDLFWAVRGAGSNFGVITTFEFRLHAVGPLVFLATTVYALEDAHKILAAWRDFVATAADEVSSTAIAWTMPPAPAFPQELHGRPILILSSLYSGSLVEGEKVLQPLREVATPLLDMSGPIPYVVAQSFIDGFFPKGLLYYWKSLYLDHLDDDVIDEIIRYANQRPSPMSMVGLWQLGGAINRVGASETAFPHRQAPFLLSLDSSWVNPEETERNIGWTREVWKAMHRFSSGGLYLNFPGFGEEKKDELARAGYGPNFERLVALKDQYDPGNLFRMNQNIKPSA